MDDFQLRAPKAPLVTSTWSASLQTAEWLKQHQTHFLTDALEGIWETFVRESIVSPSGKGTSNERCLHLRHVCELKVEDFKKQGIFGEGDERLLSFLEGDAKIKVSLQSKPLHAPNEEWLRMKLSQYFTSLRQQMESKGFVEIKRAGLYRWIENHTRFGGER
jgi:hypothetical protein